MPTGIYKRPFSLVERFMARIKTDGPLPHDGAIVAHPEITGTQCWPWTGKPNHNGYGQMSIGRGTVKIVTHVAWYLVTGKWPQACILHKCDYPLCVRFSHLFEGTRADNAKDKCRKGRARSWWRRKPK